MNADIVIGVGNSFRRDDGVGLIVADGVARHNIAGLQVITTTGEPGALLDAWADAGLAVVVDAAMGPGSTPGQIQRWTPGTDSPARAVSSHAVGIPQAYELGRALGRLPDRLVVLSVGISDANHGVGLTPEVAAAVPLAVETVLAELGVRDSS